MASEGAEHVDGVAEDLHSAAKGVLEKPSAGADANASGASAGFIQNVAHIVLDKSNQAADSSKAYIENVVHKVQDYAQSVASGTTGSTTSGDFQAVARAVHATPRITDASASGSHGGLLASVATWCSSICGSKNGNAGGEPASRSIDVKVAAQKVAQALHSSTATATASCSDQAGAVADPAPKEPKPKPSE